jgi:hypothetical protein
MNRNGNLHIGDDQLIHGLPKHMEAVAGADKNAYWEIVPGKNACATCQTMRGMRFPYRPGPVHPNCTCELRQVAQSVRRTRVLAFGQLQGYEATAFERFEAGQRITVEIRNLGPFPAGARIQVDRDQWEATGHLLPGVSESFEFTKFGDTPMTWEVSLLSVAADNSTLLYFIRG